MNREEASLLLPWLANGTLEEDQSKEVERIMKSDSSLQLEYELVLEDMAATNELADMEAVPASMPLRFNASFENLLSESSPAPNGAKNNRASSSVEQFLSFLMPQNKLQFAAIAAALLIAVQAGALVMLVGNQNGSSGEFQTASDRKPEVTSGATYLVQFSPTASISDISAFLDNNGGRIVEGPLSGNLFRLRFSTGADISSPDLENQMHGATELFSMVLKAN